MILLVDPVGNFPINDDWVYAAAVRSVLNGHFEVYSFSSANVGILAYWGAGWAWLFGFSFTTLRYATLVLGAVGVLAIYLAVRGHVESRRIALIAALSVAFNPVYFALSCSFMTDVPFMASVALSVFAILRGFERDDERWIAAGLFVALASVTFRQFAVVVLAGFALGHVGRRPLTFRTVLVAVLPLLAGLLVNALLSHWLASSGRKPASTGIASLWPDLSSGGFARLKWSLLAMLTTLGLMLLPVAALCAPRFRSGNRRRNLFTSIVLGSVVLVLVAILAARGLSVPVGENVLDWYGIGPLTNGDTLMHGTNLPNQESAARIGWMVITGLVTLSSALLLLAIATASRDGLRNIAHQGEARASLAPRLFLIGVCVSYFFLMLLVATRFTLFDRYLLPELFLAFFVVPALLGRTPSERDVTGVRSIAAGLLLALFAVFTVVSTHDFLAWHRTRWAALQELLDHGVPPSHIDGGYEFGGWLLYDDRHRTPPGKNWWWIGDDEFQTSSGPLPGYEICRVHPVPRWWTSAGRDVFIMRRRDAPADAC